jgi:hypothetical protein
LLLHGTKPIALLADTKLLHLNTPLHIGVGRFYQLS